eukprot:m.257128 g.257128  ORF g.257128 m.257128 type:complete len:51 (-) comp20672_c0_seq1:230-382(-)
MAATMIGRALSTSAARCDGDTSIQAAASTHAETGAVYCVSAASLLRSGLP